MCTVCDCQNQGRDVWGRGGGQPLPNVLGRSVRKVGKIVALHATTFSTPLKFFVWFNKDPENAHVSFTKISNLVGKRSSFTDSCSDFTDDSTIFQGYIFATWG